MANDEPFKCGKCEFRALGHGRRSYHEFREGHLGVAEFTRIPSVERGQEFDDSDSASC